MLVWRQCTEWTTWVVILITTVNINNFNSLLLIGLIRRLSTLLMRCPMAYIVYLHIKWGLRLTHEPMSQTDRKILHMRRCIVTWILFIVTRIRFCGFLSLVRRVGMWLEDSLCLSVTCPSWRIVNDKLFVAFRHLSIVTPYERHALWGSLSLVRCDDLWTVGSIWLSVTCLSWCLVKGRLFVALRHLFIVMPCKW